MHFTKARKRKRTILCKKVCNHFNSKNVDSRFSFILYKVEDGREVSKCEVPFVVWNFFLILPLTMSHRYGKC